LTAAIQCKQSQNGRNVSIQTLSVLLQAMRALRWIDEEREWQSVGDDTFDDTFTVQDLTAVGLTRWFEAGPAPMDKEGALTRLQQLMTPDNVKWPFRSVALDSNGHVRAKVGGYITTSGCLTFWAVYHSEGEESSTRRELTRLLIRSCIERARKTPGVRFVETKPAYDTPDQEIFLSELRRAGLHEVATSHLYVCDLENIRDRGCSPLPDLELWPSCLIAPGCLARLFAASQIGTLDRAQQTSPTSSEEVLLELRQWAGATVNTSLWSVALLKGNPVGFALCGVSGPSNAPPEGATLVELGVIPEARRKGIGTWLVREILWSIKSRGIRTVEALIDDENIPSQRLHERIGFIREPNAYWTWRCLIKR
jgi:ribosomal protein S18 acetylase RimI-like enzyme